MLEKAPGLFLRFLISIRTLLVKHNGVN